MVGKLIPFLRSSVWITTGFGAKYAGPGGTNFKCNRPLVFAPVKYLFLPHLDTDEQLEEFRKDPKKLAKYSRDIEGELNKRFTLASIAFHPCD